MVISRTFKSYKYFKIIIISTWCKEILLFSDEWKCNNNRRDDC